MPAIPDGPMIFPLLYLNRGQVVRPAEGGYGIVEDDKGTPVDVFDVTDSLFSRYHCLYLVDMDGIANNDPQLDYLQEISTGHKVWVEAGPKSADQVIDVLVAGAERAILSTAALAPMEGTIRNTLALTEAIALSIALAGDRVASADRTFDGQEVSEFVENARGWGLKTFILESTAMGWETVGDLSKESQIYVKNLEIEEMESLRASRAAGGIMEVHLNG